jgi:hypothetical protein
MRGASLEDESREIDGKVQQAAALSFTRSDRRGERTGSWFAREERQQLHSRVMQLLGQHLEWGSRQASRCEK